MTVVEKTVTTVTVTEMGMKSTQRLYCKQKGSIHPFVEVYRPLEQPRSMSNGFTQHYERRKTP